MSKINLNARVNNLFSKILYLIPDKFFCKITYILKHKRFPNVKSPIYFNDKLLNLKLTERTDFYKTIVNKFDVRKYIAENIGAEYLIPIIGIYEKAEDIVFDNLPSKCVIKITNGSQNNIICTDKQKINWAKQVNRLNKWLKFDYYKRTREWPYKDQQAKILIETFLDNDSCPLMDYKFWCFNGKPKIVQIDIDRFVSHKRDFYDIEFNNKLDIKVTYPNSNKKMLKPDNYDLMVSLVKKLSKRFKFVRVDLYNTDGKIYFGELTLYPGNCNEVIYPIKYEEILGSYLKI